MHTHTSDRDRIERLFADTGEKLLRALMTEDRVGEPPEDIIAGLRTRFAIMVNRVDDDEIKEWAQHDDEVVCLFFMSLLEGPFLQAIAHMRPS